MIGKRLRQNKKVRRLGKSTCGDAEFVAFEVWKRIAFLRRGDNVQPQDNQRNQHIFSDVSHNDVFSTAKVNIFYTE